MNQLLCDRFERRLNEVLDQRQSPQQNHELSRHANECESCRQLLNAYSIVFGDMAAAFQPDRLPKRQPAVFGFVAVAAAAIIVSLFLPLDLYEPNVPSAPLPDATIRQQVAQSFEPAGSNPAIARDFDAAVESFSEFVELSTSHLRPVARPIRPLADSMTSTLNVLRHAMSGGRRVDKPVNVEDSAVDERLLLTECVA